MLTSKKMTGIEFLRNLVKDKRVAIVGNAKSIFDKENGKKIDSYEVVIRFNRGFIIKPESQGTKTDIVILACEINLDEKASYNAKVYVNRSKNTTCGDITLDNQMRKKWKDILGAQPSSGLLAIDLCKDAKEIALFGFDWVSPTFYNPDGYITKHNFEKEREIIQKMKLSIF